MGILADLHASGMTIVLITHEPEVAAHAHRQIHVRDGFVTDGVPALAGSAA